MIQAQSRAGPVEEYLLVAMERGRFWMAHAKVANLEMRKVIRAVGAIAALSKVS